MRLGPLEIFRWGLRLGRTRAVSTDPPQLTSPLRDGEGPFQLIAPRGPEQLQVALFRSLRRAIPTCDLAVRRKKALLGTFRVECPNPRVQRVLDEFLEAVPVITGPTGTLVAGYRAYLDMLVDAAYEVGWGAGELVPSRDLRGISRMLVAAPESLRFRPVPNGGWEAGTETSGSFRPLPHPERVGHLAFSRVEGRPYGQSLFHSVTGFSRIFEQIWASVYQNWWRFGNLRFVVTVEGGPDATEADVRKMVGDAMGNFDQVMQAGRRGQVRDFFSGFHRGAKLNISVLGADATTLDFSEPYEAMLDQIAAACGLPDWMLGLHRGTTERKSTNELDMVISDVWHDRESVESLVRADLSQVLTFAGLADGEFAIVWEPVALLDQYRDAQTALIGAQARRVRIESDLALLAAGLRPEEV